MAFGFRGHGFPFSFLSPLSEPLLDTWCAECWGPRRVCCQEGTQAPVESSQVGECPTQESWGRGAEQETLLPHIDQGQMSSAILPQGCEVQGSYPCLGPQTFYGLTAGHRALFIMAGRCFGRGVCSSVIPHPVMENGDSQQSSEDQTVEKRHVSRQALNGLKPFSKV